MACHCDDYSKAQAGRGLRGIEPGMPVPAGTGLSRRSFLARSSGLALSVFGGTMLSRLALEEGIAAAAGSSSPVLVSIFMSGGFDAMSMLAPIGDPRYASLRPNIGMAPSGNSADVFSEDDRLHWHPSAAPLRDLHLAGKVSVMPAVGYDNSNQSHFTSRHYYEVGGTDATLRTGWLGRYLDHIGTQDNPLQGLTLDVAMHPSIATARVPVATLAAADQYTYVPPGLPAHPLEASILQEAANIGAAHAKSTDAGLAAAGQIAYDAHHLYFELGTIRSGFTSPVQYPSSTDPFPHRLAGLAAMLAQGLPVSVVGLTVGHFDTHAGQAASLQRDLQLASASLLAFQRDLEARGIADRVITHVWSEFGRRGAENASGGTDHGSAGIGFLIGSKVKGQQLGEHPGVSAGLDPSGNLKPTADFRAIYAALLEQWFNADSNAILPGISGFQRPALLR
jgi:uncharacterized protein (DUF1501 family)